MTRVHAFADDALGDLDAVGLVESSAPAASGHRRWSRPRSPARSRSTPSSTRSRTPTSTGPRARPHDPRGGFFAASRRSSRTTSTSPACRPSRAPTRGRPRRRKVDGDFARMYLGTGLLALGKTQLSEFGFSARAEHPRLGPVRSPWDLDHTAGASSAGSAALVAAGAVPIAHANDGGGSIRIPAAVNGLVGLKPTRGRLRAGQDDARDAGADRRRRCASPASVRDTAAFFREAERVYRNLRLPPIGDITRPGQAGSGSPWSPRGSAASATPGGDRADPEDRRAARGARPPGAADRQPAAGGPRRRLPPLLVDAGAGHGARRPAHASAARGTPSQLDNLTLGLARPLWPQPAPAAAARSRGCAGARARRGRSPRSTTCC